MRMLVLINAAREALRSGHLSKAEELCNAFLAENPRSVAGKLLRARVRSRLRATHLSVQALERATRRRPSDFAGYYQLALAHRALGQLDRALDEAKQAASIRTDDLKPFCLAAECAFDIEHFDECESLAAQAIAIEPGNLDALLLRFNALKALGKNDIALELLKGAERSFPTAWPIVFELSQFALFLGEYGEAERAARSIVEKGPTLPQGPYILGRALAGAGKLEEALKYASEAARVAPDVPDVHSLLASVLLSLARGDEAREEALATIALDPRQGSGYYFYFLGHRATDSDSETIGKMRALSADGSSPLAERDLFEYALAKALEDTGDYSGAMEHYDLANQEAFVRKFGPNHSISSAELRQFGAARELFASIDPSLPDESSTQLSEIVPILVIGMPRSGTTLVHQILSAHPDVAGAGELPFWHERLSPCVQATMNLQPADLVMLATDYRSELNRYANGKRWVVDKRPTNFVWLGIIQRALPQAKVIHIRRDALDNCLSIYSTANSALVGWWHNRQAIVRFYNSYQRAMNYWDENLDEHFVLDIQYEDLVSRPDDVIPKILEHCGLGWTDACLRPEDNRSPVWTPSVAQVRNPINGKSVGRWKRFATVLGEFEDLNSECGPEDQKKYS